jgi:ankyrin repeat protein
VTGGHTEVVRLLLEAGADPNVYDAIQVTPLHLAAQGLFVDRSLLYISLKPFISSELIASYFSTTKSFQTMQTTGLHTVLRELL